MDANPKEVILHIVILLCLSLVAAGIELAVIDAPAPHVFAAEKSLKEGKKRADRAKVLGAMATYEKICPDGKCDIEGLTVVVYITLETAKKHYDSAEAQFVDSRKEEDFKKEHVPYFTTNLPISAFTGGWPEALDNLMKEMLTIIYCDGAGCDASQNVALNLIHKGFKKVMIVEEGFPGWKKAKYPIETEEGVVNE